DIYESDGRFAAAIEGLSLKSLPPEALRPPLPSGTGDSPKQIVDSDPAMRSAGRGTDAAIRPQLKEAPSAERRELLVGFVRQQAMKTLGITETIDAARPLRELVVGWLLTWALVDRV